MGFKDVVQRVYGFLVTRTRQRFNVENRAARLLDRDKLPPPPKFEADKHILDQIKQDAKVLEELNKVDEQLIRNVGKLHIHTSEPAVEQQMRKPENLPKSRELPKDPAFGYVEPDVIPPGRITISMLADMIELKHGPQKKSHEEIANQFKLNTPTVETLLYYYRPFLNFKPPDDDKNKKSKQLDSGEGNTLVQQKKQIQ